MESATRLEHFLPESEKNQTFCASIKYSYLSTSLSSQISLPKSLYIILSMIIFVESNLCFVIIRGSSEDAFRICVEEERSVVRILDEIRISDVRVKWMGTRA